MRTHPVRSSGHLILWFAVLLVIASGAVPFSVQAQANAPTSQGEIQSTPVEASPIRLQAGIFTPTAGESLNIPADLSSEGAAADGSRYYIVQFTGPVQEPWKEAVEKAGGTLFDYIPDFAFIVRMDTAARAAVMALPVVAWVGPYQPAYRLSPDLAGSTGMLDLVVQTFPDAEIVALSGQMDASGAMVADADTPSAGGEIRVQIDAAHLKALAQIPAVRWIEPAYERVLTNDVARSDGIMAAESVWNNLSLYGQGQVVAVADTGLDSGNLATLHQDFSGSPTGCSGTTRIVATFARGKTGDWSDTFGTPLRVYGHGTHVAGSVLGNGCRSGSNGTPNYTGSYAGLAPQAGLVFQAVMDSSGYLTGLPSDLNELFTQARMAGARIHTNSWGSAVAGQYTTDARNTDLFTWNNKDETILFAAGNNGADANKDGIIDSDSLYSPGTAKNAITVGATENYRPSYCPSSTWGSNYGEPIASDCKANNPAGMAAFSSRGPTDDGRIKPDVVSPGAVIQSTRALSETNPYRAMSGTSMATPLTAGAIALIREFYTDVKGVTPSGALLKATVINSATDLYPGQYTSPSEQNPHLPNYAQGWGRVNVANAVSQSRIFQDVADASGLSTGKNQGYTYQVSTASSFKVTLVWTDYPGATLAARELVNDLDLIVTAPGGTVYRGNIFSGGWSTTGGSADRVNNVESVYINAPASGTWTVTVSGYNVPNGNNGKQGYGLVADMPSDASSFNLTATPSTLNVCAPNDAAYQVNVSAIAGFKNPVTPGVKNAPAGTSAMFSSTPVIPSGTSTLTVGNTSALTAGSYTFDVTGTSDTLTRLASVTLNVSTLPGAITLSVPSDGSTEQAQTPTFTWNADTDATSYDIQVATDPAFTDIVASATGLTGTSFTPGTALNSGTVYYWRVQATNACGVGSYATAFHFTTGAAAGDCSAGLIPDVLLSQNFDAGTNGWTHEGTGDTWATWSTNVHSGSAAFHANDPATRSDQRLVSPAVTLPTGQSPLTVQFWNRQVIEPATSGCNDGGILEVSTDSGATWSQITTGLLTDPYNGSLSTSNPLGKVNAWCGSPQDWLKTVVSLDAYAGKIVSFRFRLGSNNSVAQEGWTIDDVVVQSCQTCAAPAMVMGAAIDWTSSQVQVTWDATAGAVSYEVWSAANQPYFTPGADCSNPAPFGCEQVTGTSFQQTAPTGDLTYIVRAVSSCGERATSYPRIGRFSLALVAGKG
jgi:subtilisin family serine protease